MNDAAPQAPAKGRIDVRYAERHPAFACQDKGTAALDSCDGCLQGFADRPSVRHHRAHAFQDRHRKTPPLAQSTQELRSQPLYVPFMFKLDSISFRESQPPHQFDRLRSVPGFTIVPEAD